jgi:hypothetical protein
VQSLEAKEPFSQYAVVAKNNPPPRGLKVEYGSPTDPSTYPLGTFDIVIDNNGKSMEECQPLIDTYAKEVRGKCMQSCAGAMQGRSRAVFAYEQESMHESNARAPARGPMWGSEPDARQCCR